MQSAMNRGMLSTVLVLTGCIAIGAEQPRFELRLVSEEPSSTTREYSLPGRKGIPTKVHVETAVLLGSDAVQSARIERREDGGYGILVTFTETGAELFGEITSQNVNKQIALFVGGQLYSTPFVREPILGGTAHITGNFTAEQAARVAAIVSGSEQ